MQKKSSAGSSRIHPRIPPEHSGVQVNHCKSPGCINYGIAAEQKSVPGSNRYTLEGKRGISSCLCTSCAVEFPLKSNIGIVEELERIASYLSSPAPLCCPNKVCASSASYPLAPPGHTHLSARRASEIRAGAATSVARRSRKTSRPLPGRGSLIRI